jgi:hypothetical protein
MDRCPLTSPPPSKVRRHDARGSPGGGQICSGGWDRGEDGCVGASVGASAGASVGMGAMLTSESEVDEWLRMMNAVFFVSLEV